MSEGITVKSALGICPYFMLVIGLSGISGDNQCNDCSKKEDLQIVSTQVKIPYIDFGNSITLQTSTASNNGVDILHNFVSSIIKEMRPLDADIAEFVSENFWDLI